MQQPFKNILCVVSAEHPHPATVERAVSLAQNSQAQLTFVDVLPRLRAGIALSVSSTRSTDLQAAMTAERLLALQSMTQRYQQQVRIQHEVLTGTAFLEIIRAVVRNGHDLVLKPAENPGFIQRMFGGDDMQLLRACPCPVWITRPEEESNYRNILVAIDVDADAESKQPASIERNLNQQILELACALALSDFAALDILHIWDAPGESIIRTWSDNPGPTTERYIHEEHARHQQALDDAQASLREHLGAETYNYIAPRFHLRRGMPATAIPEAARQLRTDVVLMGTIARSGIAGLFIGNTAEAILEQLICSVLAVKPDGFVSPVSPNTDEAAITRD